MAEERVQRRLAAILAADVVGYSRMMGQDDEGTLKLVMAHLSEFIEPCVVEHRGRVFKTTGDGILGEFFSVVDAVRCAVAIQEGMTSRNSGVLGDGCIQFRIGVNLGDVIIQDDDVFGDGVNVAARLEALAEPGSVLISGSVHEQVVNKLELEFDDLGPQRVKNIGDPVRAFHVRPIVVEASEGHPENAPTLPDKPSIAVLPFENMSADPEQEFFSDGITEDIITELSKISGLFVIARHSAFTYKGKSVTLKQVGRELGVRCVLEGSVRKVGNRLRITAQLIDAATDHHLWAERYDREIEDIFALQEEVARQVAKALQVALLPEENRTLGHALTENLESYELYLQTRMAFWPPSRENILNAQIAYGRIVDVDPNFAGGFAGKSISHSMLVIYKYSSDQNEDMRVAADLANKAVLIDDQLALSHSALAMACSALGKHEDAVEAARRAVELQPGDGDSLMFLSASLSYAGRYDEAREAALTAHRIDPKFGPYLNAFARACFLLGHYKEASEAYELGASIGAPVAAPMLISWIVSLTQLGRVEEAKKKAQELLLYRPDFTVSGTLEIYPFGDAAITIITEGLRKAGLPE